MRWLLSLLSRRRRLEDQAPAVLAPLRAEIHLTHAPDVAFRAALRDVLTSPKDER